MGGPEGLVAPLSSPSLLFSKASAVGLKQGKEVGTCMLEVGTAKDVVTTVDEVSEGWEEVKDLWENHGDTLLSLRYYKFTFTG